MESRAKMLGHAIHPMLIPFPLGLLATAVVFDILYLITGVTGLAIAAFFAIAAGLVGGVLASIFGLADWLVIADRTRAKRVGKWHGLGNAAVLAVFLASWLIRLFGADWHPGAAAIVLSVIGGLGAGVTAWLGGELVERLGVSVSVDANPDAPSSLSRHRSDPMTR